MAYSAKDSPDVSTAPASEPDALQEALALHQRGMFSDAEKIYDDILRAQPDHADALHYLGLLALQTQRPERSLALLRQAIGLNQNVAAYHSNLGLVLFSLNQVAAAIASYDSAIALQPDYADAHFNRAILLSSLLRPDEAVDGYHRVVALRPDHLAAHAGLGRELLRLGRYEAALASLDTVIALQPDHAEAHCNRGVALWNLQRLDEALASSDTAIALNPDYAEAHSNRGMVLWQLKMFDAALDSCDRAIALQPDYAEAHGNRGSVLLAMHRYADALASCDRSIALKPADADAHGNRGNVLQEMRRYEEALVSYDTAITLRSDDAGAYGNRGVVLQNLRRLEEALASCDQAVALRPDDAYTHASRSAVLYDLRRYEEALTNCDATIALKPDYARGYWNKSLCLLHLGQFEQGWKLFEWRKKLDKPIANRVLPRPLWLGEEAIAGRTMFLHFEQGLGDTLQFCRYALLVKARGARVILSVQDPLLRLIQRMDPAMRIIGGNQEPVTYDFHCPLMSLPLALGTSVETIPSPVPYLHADTQRAAAWRERLAHLPGRKIGLVWAGAPRHDDAGANAVDKRRSITLAHYAPLAAIPGLCLISLQKGEAAAQARMSPDGMVLHDWTAELHDFADTADLVAALDLVISVDTSVVHLAGALGKPVWVLNRYDQCWRWPRDRDESPWYPTARLFRQQEPGNWDAVINRVTDALNP